MSINDIDCNKTVTSKKLPFGKQDFKYFISHNDSKNQTFMHITPQTIIYKRNFDENRCIYFLVKLENVFLDYTELKSQRYD